MLQLLKNRSFSALTLSQFLGAFNDNAFKKLVLMMAAGMVPAEWVADSVLPNLGNPQVLPATLFSLPFVLFGALTGSLADRVSKSTVIKAANVLEIIVMVIGLIAFRIESYDLLIAAVFLMGTQSALFGPAKYGSIKEIVGERNLSSANALIQATTMIAILMGVMLGGWLGENFEDALWITGVAYIFFATMGMLASLRIEPLAARNPDRRLDWNVFSELRSHWKATNGDRTLILSIVASAFFYLVAATLLLIVTDFGVYLGLTPVQTAGFDGMTVLGIAVGSIFAGKLSRERVEAGLVPLGLFGIAVSLLAVQLAPRSMYFVYVCMFCTGTGAGLFSVPIRALIQLKPSDENRGAILGLSEVCDFVGILLAGAVVAVLSGALGLSPPQMFFSMGVLVLVFMGVSLLYTAEFAVRLGLFLLVHSVYRIRTRGMENLPRQGGALMVVNHVSFVDALLIGAAAPRPVRFLMYRAFFDVPVVGWFARKMGVIPVSAGDTRRQKVEALKAASKSAADGHLVCIFAEGSITRTGTMLPFARGMERIARDAGVPIVPIALDRVWGSIFSFESGRVFWKRPHRIPYPVDVIVGKPLPSDTPAWEVRNSIQELVAEKLAERKGRRGSLAWRFLRAARIHARKPAIVDSNGTQLSYRKLLIGTLAMRRMLSRELDGQMNVALMVPPSAGGAIANLSLALLGRVSVNLNYTMNNAALAAPIRTAGVTQLLTSRRFLKILKRDSPMSEESTLYLEDLSKKITKTDKLVSVLLSLLPPSLLARAGSPQRSARETATIIFSSGSMGEPKGVMLSHANILSNVQGVLQTLSIGKGDGLFGVLPFFHSFGYTVTLWGPLLAGAKAIYHANPLDAKVIGEMSEEHRATIFVATPTFYQAYMRRCSPEQFAHLRVALSGAEKLRRPLANAWEEKYGLPLMEGYGCTELSPVVSFNVPDVELMGERQLGNKPGTIGRALPGIATRIVDPDTGVRYGPGEEGLLLVKGPNVMQGYYNDPEKTAEVIQDGWYSTGDIAIMDAGGFLAITDRLSRFSKIGGEMVPHGRVEECLEAIVSAHALDPESPAEVAVTALPDEKKGEQLVVLHTSLPISVEALLEELARGDLPKLFQPRAQNFIEVEAIPKLGTGKTNLKGLKQIASSARAPE